MSDLMVILLMWLPVVLGAGVFMRFGRRGKLVWVKKKKGQVDVGGQYCGGCGYDLRGTKFDRITRCPECGWFLVDGVNIFNGMQSVRWSWMLGGVLAVGWPLVLYFGFGMWSVWFGYGVQITKYHTDAYYDEISVAELVEHVKDDEFVFKLAAYEELNERVLRGELTIDEGEVVVKHRIEVLEEMLEEQLEAGGMMRLEHDGSDVFLRTLVKKHLIAHELLVDLIVAERGVSGITDRGMRREGRVDMDVNIVMNEGFSFGHHVLFDFERVWVNGEKVEDWVKERRSYEGVVSFSRKMGQGWHDVEVEVVMGVVDDLVGHTFSRKAFGEWPKVKGVRRKRVKKRYYIWGKDEPLVKLNLDEADDPVKNGTVKVYRVNRLKFGESEALGVMLRWDDPLSSECYLKVDEGEGRKAELLNQYVFSGGKKASANAKRAGTWMKEYRLVLNEEEVERLRDGEGKVVIEMRPNAMMHKDAKILVEAWGGVVVLKEGEDFEVVDMRRGEDEEGVEK
ncbi:hypothetical protein JD969_07505 [Planctomycetota bacterium]|nr:hypothetical protein JD969_07505 [Planctomycetota bacterium]